MDDGSLIALQPTRKQNLASFTVLKDGKNYEKGMHGIKKLDKPWYSKKFRRKFSFTEK